MVVFIWVMVDTTVVIILIILLIMVVVTTRGIVVITMYTAIRWNMAEEKDQVLYLQTGIKMNQALRIPEETEVVLHQPEDLIQEEGQSQDHNQLLQIPEEIHLLTLLLSLLLLRMPGEAPQPDQLSPTEKQPRRHQKAIHGEIVLIRKEVLQVHVLIIRVLTELIHQVTIIPE